MAGRYRNQYPLYRRDEVEDDDCNTTVVSCNCGAVYNFEEDVLSNICTDGYDLYCPECNSHLVITYKSSYI